MCSLPRNARGHRVGGLANSVRANLSGRSSVLWRPLLHSSEKPEAFLRPEDIHLRNRAPEEPYETLIPGLRPQRKHKMRLFSHTIHSS